jgi:hypothetical protein
MSEKIAWVAVGTNPDKNFPTWFYAFTTSKKAEHFLSLAKYVRPGITWLTYPCVLESAEAAFNNFLECLDEERTTDQAVPPA